MKVTALKSEVAESNIKYEIIELKGVTIFNTYIRTKNPDNSYSYELADSKVIHDLP